MRDPDPEDRADQAVQPGSSTGHANAMGFPPINMHSTLLAAQPLPELGAESAQPDEDLLTSFLDTHDLYAALTRSQQIAGGQCGGMRCVWPTDCCLANRLPACLTVGLTGRPISWKPEMTGC